MKRRAVLTLAATAAIGGVTAIPAQASSCRSVSCLQKQVNQLQKVVIADTKYLYAFTKCMTEVPVSEYGDGSGGTFGYSYNSGNGSPPALTTAVDGTNPGTNVGSWLMTDGCNSQTSATVNFRTTARSAASATFGTAFTRLFSFSAQPASVFGPLTAQVASLTPHAPSN